MEAYPKSKNKELYFNIIDFDPKNRTQLIPFEFFSGVSPKRYLHVYSQKNKPEDSEVKPPLIRLIRFESPGYYKKKEDDIIEAIDKENPNALDCLIGKSEQVN